MQSPQEPRRLFKVPPPPSPQASALLSVILGGMGGFIVLLYLGVIPWRPTRYCRAVFCDPYHWQVLCFGLAFLMAGLAFVIPQRWRLLGKTGSWIFVVTLLSAIVGSFAAR